jgi:ubiquitin-protein ligase
VVDTKTKSTSAVVFARKGVVPVFGVVPTITAKKKRSVRTSTILRLQREWQQMIQSGVAYDWYHQKPIQTKLSPAPAIVIPPKHNASITESKNDWELQQLPPKTSHIWIGPISKHQWYVWHFTFTCHDIGNENDNPYFHGVYHGRIVLSKEYPLRPPVSIQLFTPNGRFRTHQNICFTSITHYHPDQWNTNTNIYSMIESLRYHLVTSPPGLEIGAISYTSWEQKQSYAIHSQSFRLSIPIIQNRPSSRTTTTIPTTKSRHTLTNRRNVVIIDHHEMIQKGHVTIPRWETGKISHGSSSNHTPFREMFNTTRNMKYDKEQYVDQSFSVESTDHNASTATSTMNHLASLPKRKKRNNTTTGRKTKASRKNVVTSTTALGRRPWNALLRQHFYYQCGMGLLAVLVLSSSSSPASTTLLLQNPYITIGLVVVITSTTLWFQNQILQNE